MVVMVGSFTVPFHKVTQSPVVTGPSSEYTQYLQSDNLALLKIRQTAQVLVMVVGRPESRRVVMSRCGTRCGVRGCLRTIPPRQLDARCVHVKLGYQAIKLSRSTGSSPQFIAASHRTMSSQIRPTASAETEALIEEVIDRQFKGVVDLL